MPTVPTYQGPQVRTAPLQYAPQQAARSDAAFGGARGRQFEALGTAVSQVGDAMRRVEEHQAQTQAFELDARVTEDWLKWEGENRQRFTGANAEGYTAAVEEWWKKREGELITGTPDRVKKMVSRSLGMRRLQALGSATNFVGVERERHAAKAYEADLQATIDFGLTTGTVGSATGEVRGRVAAFAARRGWTSEMAQAEVTKALTQLHGQHITRLLDVDPDAAKAHLLASAGEIDARSRMGFEQAIEKAAHLSKAQSFADSTMQRGLGLDQALKEAESLSGDAERMAKIEIRQRFADVETARRQVQDKTYGTALLQIEQRGRVSPSTFAALDDRHKADVLNRMQAEAKAREAAAAGKPIKTDWNTYLSLRDLADNDPTAFAKVDLRQHLDKIGPGQMEQLRDTQTRLRKPEKDPKRRSEQTVSARVSDFSSGLDMSTTKRAQFRSYVHDQIREQEVALDRDLKDEEITTIMDRALLKPPGFFQDRTFESAFQQRRANATRGASTPQPAPPVRVSTPQEARALHPGTRFQTPDGRILVR